MRAAIRALLVLSCVLVVTVSGATAGSSVVTSSASLRSRLVTRVRENKVALLCTAAIAVVAYLYSRSPSTTTRQHRRARQCASVDESLDTPLHRQGEAEAEAAAVVYAARGDHASAARSYTEAAECCRAEAEMLSCQEHALGAAASYIKSAAMYAAAARQASLMEMVSGGDRTGSEREQCRMHHMAAACYESVAEEHAAAGRAEQARAMSLAAVEQYEACAECALICRDYGFVAGAYSAAANRHAAFGDCDKVQSLKAAAAEKYASHGAQLAHAGDLAGAVSAYRRAIEDYEAAGQPNMARFMSRFITKLHRGRVASDRRVVADGYETLE